MLSEKLSLDLPTYQLHDCCEVILFISIFISLPSKQNINNLLAHKIIKKYDTFEDVQTISYDFCTREVKWRAKAN